MTNKELTIRGLHARGFTVDSTARTSKYLVFQKPGFSRRYLIGHAGALRCVPDSNTVATSISLTGTRSHKAFQEVGRHAESITTAEQAEAIFDGELRARKGV